jgi:predicted acylesterase/phospholipase RssA
MSCDDKQSKQSERSQVHDTIRPSIVIIGPGGIKGYLELGALFHLEKNGYLKKVQVYCGVSVGSIIALLLSCGCDVGNIIRSSLQIQAFEYNGLADFGKKGVGIFNNDKMRQYLIELVKDRLAIDYVPTFKQLYYLTGKILVVTTTKRKGESFFFSPEETPDDNIVNAVMGSINIPIVFGDVEINGEIHDDGAIGNCCPTDYFDDGINVIFTLFIEQRVIGKEIIHVAQNSICSMMRFHRNRIISECSDKCFFIELLSDTIDVIGIASDADAKAKMLVAGMKTCENFLTEIENNNTNKRLLKSYSKPKKRAEAKYPISNIENGSGNQ